MTKRRTKAALLRVPFEELLEWSVGKKPAHPWRGAWPQNTFVLERGPSISIHPLIQDLIALNFKVVYCCDTNKQLDDATQHFRGLRMQRFVSKGQHLQQRLDSIGVEGFRVAYYSSKSPYASTNPDKRTTLRNLRSALNAAGHQELDHELLFYQEYEEYKSEPLRGYDTQLFLFTNAAFVPRLHSSRIKWWERMDLIAPGYREIEVRGKDVIRLTPLPRIAVIFDEPNEDHFDTQRMVHEDDVAALKKGRHDIIERNGFYYEKRPEYMTFCNGIDRGFQNLHPELRAKLIVSTGKTKLATLAYNTLVKARNVEWLRHAKSNLTKTTLLLTQGSQL